MQALQPAEARSVRYTKHVVLLKIETSQAIIKLRAYAMPEVSTTCDRLP